jgi:hypothetical protein
LVGAGQRQGDGDGGAEVGTGAGGGDVAALLTDDVADEEEAEAGAFDLGHGAAGDAVEAGEDAFELVGGEADAGVGDAESDEGVAGDGERAADMDAVWGVFDGIVEDVDDGGAEVFGDAEGEEADGSRGGFEDDAGGREMVALEGDGDAVAEEGFEVDEGAVLQAMALAELTGFEDLLDGGEKAVGVGEHDLVELLALGFVDGAALEGFEVETNAGDGGFELVGHGVEEGVLTFVAADLSNEEDGVEDDTGDEGSEEDDTKDGQGEGAFVEDDPADVEGDGEANGESAEGDEEGDSSAASGDVHGLKEV